MAQFNGTRRNEGTRSHTRLVKSGHLSPGEEWILDPTFKDPSLSAVFKDGVLFQYLYGGPGMEEITIPQGRAVGIGSPVKDFVSQKFRSTMSLPGLTPNGNCVGVVPYNISKDWFQQDRFGGNAPSIITTEYITLPYIPGVTADTRYDKLGVIAEEQALSVDLKNPWGSVLGANIANGDYVKATPSGRFVKWDKTKDSPVDVVGQVLNLDFNQEPWGWEKWMLWQTNYRQEDDSFINRSGASNLPTDGGYPYDPTYAEGNTTFQEYQSQYLTNPTGIPGLHDGSGNYNNYGKNDTDYTDRPLGNVPSTATDNQLLTFQLLDFAGGKLTNIRQVSNIKINGIAIDLTRVTVNYKAGTVTVKMLAADANQPISATYKAYHFGTPSYLDFKGVAGACCILLQK